MDITRREAVKVEAAGTGDFAEAVRSHAQTCEAVRSYAQTCLDNLREWRENQNRNPPSGLNISHLPRLKWHKRCPKPPPLFSPSQAFFIQEVIWGSTHAAMNKRMADKNAALFMYTSDKTELLEEIYTIGYQNGFSFSALGQNAQACCMTEHLATKPGSFSALALATTADSKNKALRALARRALFFTIPERRAPSLNNQHRCRLASRITALRRVLGRQGVRAARQTP